MKHHHVFISENLPKYWNELDVFEGDEYQRIPVKVYLENGQMVESLVYALKD
ncbi:gamma-glutamylcyclotransferase family protein [Acinetobacter lwoffii]|uniref:Gamma-glutamylcyclotransferase family protein n=1 Tax=Acinetobacter lwoffii TaxID=28090 RepID=A0AAW8AUB6_ACILW|nr:gamma-glutamylcyclotransferase family protein [Acinetobacter lwoffii]MDP1369653.1 gamma-glutamylcyclotransferase family protein [Acinetobacter lwoffii]MDP1389052.1 gamma-glutamylcyclotransferase family protein [Acinetobacter lwoffii]MDP1446824.1 gamma-glutamylcyclotransferase family protein [Acinetobacter lwoffii]